MTQTLHNINNFLKINHNHTHIPVLPALPAQPSLWNCTPAPRNTTKVPIMAVGPKSYFWTLIMLYIFFIGKYKF